MVELKTLFTLIIIAIIVLIMVYIIFKLLGIKVPSKVIYTDLNNEVDYSIDLIDAAKDLFKNPEIEGHQKYGRGIRVVSHRGHRIDRYHTKFLNMPKYHSGDFIFDYKGFKWRARILECNSEGCCYSCAIGQCGSWEITPIKVIVVKP